MSLSELLPRALDLIEHRYQGERGPQTVREIRAGALDGQLEAADVCADLLIDYELTGSQPVGGSGKRSIGSYVEHDAEAREALELAIACSYLSVAGIGEPTSSDYAEDRDPADLWAWWISHANFLSLLRTPLPLEFMGSVAAEGATFLIADLKRLGLHPGIFRRRGYEDRCHLFCILGALLRFGQSEDADLEDAYGIDSQMLACFPFVKPAAAATTKGEDMGLFRRKKRLPGATADWDPSTHVDAGDGMQAIPLDQLPQEAMQRLQGVTLYEGDGGKGGHAVLVNVTAARREAEERFEGLADQYAPLIAENIGSRKERRLQEEWDAANRQATIESFNNNWVKDGIPGIPEDSDDDYQMMQVDLLTGYIGGGGWNE